MSDKEVVIVSHLSKRFGKITAVDNISFSIKENEIVGLLGPNGAGKTTTIDMLIGILKASSGTINIFGKDLEKNRYQILASMNFSAAYINLPGKMKVWENLYTFARLYSVPEYKKKVEKLLDDFELAEFRNKFMKDLSSGQQSRVYLAKAFINNPKLILLDEPTAFMDPDIADMLRKLIVKKVRENNASVIFSSHNMAEVTELCDRVIFLSQGKIIAEDTPEKLAKKIGSCKIHLLITDKKEKTMQWCKEEEISAGIDGKYITVEIEEKRISSFLSGLAEIGVEYDEISIDKPTLEDFFLKTVRNI